MGGLNFFILFLFAVTWLLLHITLLSSMVSNVTPLSPSHPSVNSVGIPVCYPCWVIDLYPHMSSICCFFVGASYIYFQFHHQQKLTALFALFGCCWHLWILPQEWCSAGICWNSWLFSGGDIASSLKFKMSWTWLKHFRYLKCTKRFRLLFICCYLCLIKTQHGWCLGDIFCAHSQWRSLWMRVNSRNSPFLRKFILIKKRVKAREIQVYQTPQTVNSSLQIFWSQGPDFHLH